MRGNGSSRALDALAERGLVASSSPLEALRVHLAGGRRTLYCGFDPTADSLHLGSLRPLTALRRFLRDGHRVIALVGGATAQVGDPSGKTGEREVQDVGRVERQAAGIAAQLERVLGADGDVVITDNREWLATLDVVAFLRDIARRVPASELLARESMRTRLAQGNMSVAELAYPVLQALDFVELYRRYGCSVQIGGSDQWGNIATGIDLVRRLEGNEVYGLTLPLHVREDGVKFGKTEAGAVWLDGGRTTPFALYQYLLNVPDAEVHEHLRALTLLGLEDIAALDGAPGPRAAQQVLAREVTRDVHGAAALAEAERLTAALFSGALVNESDLPGLVDGVPTTRLARAEVTGLDIAGLAVRCGLAASKAEVRTMVTQGALEVNGRRIEDARAPMSVLTGAHLLLRRGAKTLHLIVIED